MAISTVMDGSVSESGQSLRVNPLQPRLSDKANMACVIKVIALFLSVLKEAGFLKDYF